MIYHPLLMISILIVTLLASTNLSIIAPLIAGLILIQVLRHPIRGGGGSRPSENLMT